MTVSLVKHQPIDGSSVILSRVTAANLIGVKPMLKFVMLLTLSVAVSLYSSSNFGAAPSSSQLPTDGRLVGGQASIAKQGSVMDITQTSSRAAITWNAFDIGSGATVNISQPDASSVLANQVLSSDPSQIFGQLNANGQVFLTNPNGVYFAPGASVNVGGLVATTNTINAADFMAGITTFEGDGSAASVVNEGNLQATLGGYIALMAPTVRNDGVIIAKMGSIVLAAGSQYVLEFSGASLDAVAVSPAEIDTLVSNGNAIYAPGGRIILSAQAARHIQSGVVGNTGVIEATGFSSNGGVISLTASHNIFAGGTIRADSEGHSALTGNDGGVVSIIADLGNLDSHTDVTGLISAQGSSLGGNGGIIETSGSHVKVADSALVSTLASNGNAGTWTIDPDGFTISADGGDMSGTAVTSALTGGDFVIISTNGSGSDGDINVNEDVSWSTNQLTLTATNDINVNAVMDVSATGTLALNTGASSAVNVDFDANGEFLGSINFTQSGQTVNGNDLLTINGDSYTLVNDFGVASSVTLGDFQAISTDSTGYYALGSNLDATDILVAPIASFTGTLNGLGHTITNVVMASTQGLISATGVDSVIQNIGLEGGSLTAALVNSGGLVGHNFGTVSNSYNSGSVASLNGAIGGLIGRNEAGTISNSYASGAITGAVGVGGLIGFNNSGLITDSYAKGSVTSAAASVGGLVGYSTTGDIIRSYASGPVAGATGVGGLLGGGTTGSVTDSYTIGDVSGTTNTGGLVGSLTTGVVSLSYSTGDVTGTTSTAGLVGSTTGVVETSYSTGDISGTTSTGGLVGTTTGAVTTSYATGNITGVTHTGGLVANSTGSVTDSYATGTVVGAAGSSGGLVGTTTGAIATSYASGSSATAITKGLVGTTTAAVTNSYFDSTRNTGAGAGIGLSTLEMKRLSNFAGFSISNTGTEAMVWRIYEGVTTPLLASFLAPVALTSVYSGAQPAVFDDISGYISDVNLDVSKLISTSAGLTLSSSVTAGSATATLNGFGSLQQGYNISYVPTTITGTGSLADELNISAPINWSSGNLILNAQKSINFNSLLNETVADGSSAQLTLNYGLSSVESNNPYDYVLNSLINLPGGDNFNTTLGSDGATKNYTVITALGAVGDATSSPVLTTLQGMAATENLAGNFVLGNNIDASATGLMTYNLESGFVPIGNLINKFTGYFDGLGHTISDLSFNVGAAANSGLFGYTLGATRIQNIGLIGDGTMVGAAQTGGLVGYNESGLIRNSYNLQNVTGSAFTGGLVGQEGTGDIVNSYATGDVVGAAQTGGLLGGGSTGSINDSYATGNVDGAVSTGGLVGALSTGDITSSYASGDVQGAASTGGLVGSITTGGIVDSYALGPVHGAAGTGGLVGTSTGLISGSYAEGQVTGTIAGVIGAAAAATVGGLVGATTGDVTLSYAIGDVIAGEGAGGAGVGGLIGTTTGAVSISYAAGEVSGGANVGGLIGSSTGTVLNTYATGDVTGNTNVGGLIGTATNSVDNSYSSGVILGTNPSTTGAFIGSASVQNSNNFFSDQSNPTTMPGVGAASIAGGVTAMSPVQMEDEANFTSSTAANGDVDPDWDVVDTWINLPGTLPFLRPLMTPIEVTANSSTKIYDGIADVSSVTYSVEPASPLGGTLSFSYLSNGNTTATAPTDASSYVVTPTGLLSTQKYFVTLVSGDAVIDSLALTGGTIANAASVYGSDTTVGVLSFDNTPSGGSAVGEVALVDPTYSTAGHINVGAYDQTVAASSSGNYIYDSITALDNNLVSALELTPVSTTNASIYNGTTLASLNINLTGLLVNDAVTASGTGTLSSANAGSNTVAVTDLSLSGNDATNYFLASTIGTSTAVITAPLALTGGTITDADSIYGNETTVGTLSFDNTPVGGTALGVVSLVAPAYSSAGYINVGSYDQTAEASNSGNYSYGTVTSIANNLVTALELTATSTTNPSVYNGTTAASLTVALAGVVTGESGSDIVTASGTGTLASANAGNNRVAVTDMSLSGDDAANYFLASTSGTSTAVTTSVLALTGGIISDAASVYGNATTLGILSFDNTPNGGSPVGEVTLVDPLFSTAGFVSAGSYVQTATATSGGNYSYETVTSLANNLVSAQELTAISTTNASVYNGTTVASVTVDLIGLLTGDSGTDAVTSSGIGTLSSANAGSNTVAVTDLSLSGNDATNYFLASTSGTSTPVITSALALTGGTITNAASVYGSDTTVGVLSFDNTPSGGSAVGEVSLVDPTYSTAGHINVGTYDQIVAASSTGNYSYDSVTSLDNNLISALEITPVSTTNASVYNGTTLASLNINLTGLLENDAVIASGTGTLSSANAGSNTVAVTNLSLSGNDATNYFLASTSGTSTTVVTAPLTLTGGTITNADSIYGSEITVGNLIFDNTPSSVIAPGQVSLVDATYSSAGYVNAGSYAQTVAASTGGNFSFDKITSLANNQVSPLAVTPTSTTNPSVYDGTTDASLSISLHGLLTGDAGSDAVTASGTGTLSSANAGRNTVAVTDMILAGDDAGNYFLASTSGTSTTVTTSALALTGGSISGAASIYGSDTTAGILSFDNTPNAGSTLGEVILVNPEYSTSGNVNAGSYDQTAVASNSGNYLYGTVTSLANNLVSALEITPTATTNPSVYNGTTDASVTIVLDDVLTGAPGSDAVTVSGTATLSSANAGSNTVAVTNLSLSGDDSANYVLASTNGTSTAVITSALALTGGTIGNAASVYGGETTLGILSFDNRPDTGTEVGEVMLVDATYSTAGHVNTGSYDQIAAASNSGNYSYDTVTALANNQVSALEIIAVSTTNASVYNGTTVADLSIDLAGLLTGDSGTDAVTSSGTGTLSSANAGSNTVAVTDMSLSGDDANNYVLSSSSGVSTEVITTPLTLTGGTIANASSVYGRDTTMGVLTFDNVPSEGSALGEVTIADPIYSTSGHVKVGSYNQTATASSSGNYRYGSVTSLANNEVNVLAITPTPTSATDASMTIALDGVLDIDAVSASVTDLSLSGDDAGNYLLATTQEMTGILIARPIQEVTLSDPEIQPVPTILTRVNGSDCFNGLGGQNTSQHSVKDQSLLPLLEYYSDVPVPGQSKPRSSANGSYRMGYCNPVVELGMAR